MEKTSVKKWLRLSVILYIVILSVVAVSTFAWFVFEKTVSLESKTEMQITAGNKLEIVWMDDKWEKELSEGGWLSNIDITMDGNTMYPDISSGDGQTFYYPKALMANGDAPTNAELYDIITHNGVVHKESADDNRVLESAPEVREKYYITVNLKFRTAQAMTIYLADGSKITPVSDSDPQKDACNKALAGMVRVAFLEATLPSESNLNTAYETKNIWIPNETYQLTAKTESGDSGISDQVSFEVVDGEREDSYKYLGVDSVDGSIISKVWDVSNYLNKDVTVGGSLLAYADKEGQVPMIRESSPLLTFTDAEIEANGGLVEKCLSMRIWFEGTDREAHNALLESKINYLFKFCGIQKENSPNTQDIVYQNDALLYKNDNTQVDANVLEWSCDGIKWNPYSPLTFTQSENKELLQGVDNIYVRYLETHDKKASAHQSVQIKTSPAS